MSELGMRGCPALPSTSPWHSETSSATLQCIVRKSLVHWVEMEAPPGRRGIGPTRVVSGQSGTWA